MFNSSHTRSRLYAGGELLLLLLAWPLKTRLAESQITEVD